MQLSAIPTGVVSNNRVLKDRIAVSKGTIVVETTSGRCRSRVAYNRAEVDRHGSSSVPNTTAENTENTGDRVSRKCAVADRGREREHAEETAPQGRFVVSRGIPQETAVINGYYCVHVTGEAAAPTFACVCWATDAGGCVVGKRGATDRYRAPVAKQATTDGKVTYGTGSRVSGDSAVTMVRVPSKLYSPPPIAVPPVTLLPENVQLLIVTVPRELNRPPPPERQRPPSSPLHGVPEPLRTVRSWNVTTTPALTKNTVPLAVPSIAKASQNHHGNAARCLTPRVPSIYGEESNYGLRAPTLGRQTLRLPFVRDSDTTFAPTLEVRP